MVWPWCQSVISLSFKSHLINEHFLGIVNAKATVARREIIINESELSVRIRWEGNIANINYVRWEAHKSELGEKGENWGDGNVSFPRDKLDPVLGLINVITRHVSGSGEERRWSVSLFSIETNNSICCCVGGQSQTISFVIIGHQTANIRSYHFPFPRSSFSPWLLVTSSDSRSGVTKIARTFILK